ncbi:MAG: hypothetical protein EXR45_00690 [Chloroflexi bacterium]|nr:hypothetical protein [Chloroflexota bacterium]
MIEHSVAPAPSASTQPRWLGDGTGRLDGLRAHLVIYGLWIIIVAFCVLTFLILRAPVETTLAALYGFRNPNAVEIKFRFQATYLLFELFCGLLLFGLTVVSEHSFRTALSWSAVYQRAFLPELGRRFLKVFGGLGIVAALGIAADIYVVRFL